MGSFASLLPYGDPGSLPGGLREHRAILDGLQADVFRNASQSQMTGQSAQAFSGAAVTNDMAQVATIQQDPDALNIKTVTIDAVTATNAHAGSFNFNYLQRYLTGVNAADYLARGSFQAAQEQVGAQDAVGSLKDFEGGASQAVNTLSQRAEVQQDFDVDLSATVSATTIADDFAAAFDQARFRTIEATAADHTAQAIFANSQRQGSFANPSTQAALGNATNTLAQAATIDQNTTANTVELRAEFDLSRNETASLTPRPTALLSSMLDNSAINSSAVAQEQVLRQSGAGGRTLSGAHSESGGTANNQGSSGASATEETDVVNSITITI